jgi:hypothetical protein
MEQELAQQYIDMLKANYQIENNQTNKQYSAQMFKYISERNSPRKNNSKKEKK